MSFADDKHKAASRRDYVDNECYSDEYRETQPEKGIRHTLNALNHATVAERNKLINLMLNWLSAYASDEDDSYAGNKELDPLLELVHDILWEHDEHPYYDDVKELFESLED